MKKGGVFCLVLFFFLPPTQQSLGILFNPETSSGLSPLGNRNTGTSLGKKPLPSLGWSSLPSPSAADGGEPGSVGFSGLFVAAAP